MKRSDERILTSHVGSLPRPMELLAALLDRENGKPHLIDQHSVKPQRAVFSKCWPVLVNSAMAELRGKPLEPGGVRSFSVDLPLSGDIEDQEKPVITMEAKATAVTFSK